MKRVALSLFGFCLLFATNIFAQNVANGDMEDWELQQNLVIQKENPKAWISRNYLDDNPQSIYCYSTSDSYSGDKAAVLKNVIPSPGICLSSFLTLGIFDEDNPEHRGVAFNERPLALHFVYKYLTNNIDPNDFYVSKAIIKLTKWDPSSKMSNVIGMGEYIISERTNFFQAVELPIQYTSLDKPDSLQITFTTPSNPDDDLRLTIDDIYLDMHPVITNDDKIYLDQVSLFPNPVKDVLRFVNPTNIENTDLLLYDAFGKLLVSEPLQGTGGQISCEHLTSGFYFYQIRQDNQLVKAGKLMKAEL